MSKESIKHTQVTPTVEPRQAEDLQVLKQSIRIFIIAELCVYISQIIIFFFVAVLTSNLLRDEKQFEIYINSKINENTSFELTATVLAIAVTLGIIAGIAKAATKTSLIERVANEVLAEVPRTVYVFGSSISGTLLAWALFSQLHPDPQTSIGFLLYVALFAAFAGFIYGCFFAYMLKDKANTKVS
jgi:drug/metabolite transporter (DMT)-like permease